MKDIQILKDVFFIENQRYVSNGDYSATELIDPPRLVRMKKRYAEQITPEVDGRVDALMGTAMHALFEQNLEAYKVFDPKYDLEREMVVDVDVDGKVRKLSGRYDVCYDDRAITDIKTAKVWKKVFDPELTSWTEQQNIYAWLAGHFRKEIESIAALTIYKDWSPLNAIRDKTYPREPIEWNELPLWDKDKQLAYIMDRMRKHVACEDLDDTELPHCTPEERWERFPEGTVVQFAYFKSKDKMTRATKVLHGVKDIATAVNVVRGIKGVSANSVIEIRHAQRKRCEKYCPVSEFCDINVEYRKKVKNNTLNEIYPMSGVL